MVNCEKLLKRFTSKKLTTLLILGAITGILSITILLNLKTITLVENGQAIRFVSFTKTVGDALENKEIYIGIKDKITPALNSQLSRNCTITIKRAVNIKVAVDGNELTIKSSEDNIGSMLKSEKIQLTVDDKIKPDKETKLSEGMKVEIIRIDTKVFMESTSISYKTVLKYDSSLDNAKRKTIQEGKVGEKQVTNKVTYENGKEISRMVINEAIVKKPQDKIVVQGTMKKMHVSRGASQLNYSKVFNTKATAYYAFLGKGKTYTSSGRIAVRDPEGYSTIAVDPRIIPYGTKLYVEGYGYAIAADSGGAIKGNIIDVYFDTKGEAYSWGVKYVDVYVLND